MTTYRFFTQPLLLEAARIGRRRGYNRQLNPAQIAKADPETKFPVMYAMEHALAAGEPVERHVRAVIATPAIATIDVDMDLFNDLPAMEVNTKEKQQ